MQCCLTLWFDPDHLTNLGVRQNRLAAMNATAGVHACGSTFRSFQFGRLYLGSNRLANNEQVWVHLHEADNVGDTAMRTSPTKYATRISGVVFFQASICSLNARSLIAEYRGSFQI